MSDRDSYTFWDTQQVRWGDMDAQGHVNNTVYFVYCESARTAWFRHLGLDDLRDPSQGPALIDAQCTYRQQVHYPATLEVGVRVAKVRNRSFTLEYGIYLHGEPKPAARGSSAIVWIDFAAGKAVQLPQRLRDALQPPPD